MASREALAQGGIINLMKICYISNVYPPHVRGGAERVVAQLAREMSNRGHHVDVLTSAPWSEVEFGEIVREENGVRVHRMFHWTLYFNLFSARFPTGVRLINLIWSLINVPFALRVLLKLRTLKPDVVHTHNLAGTSFLIPLVVRALHLKHVHTVHDIQLAVASGRMLVDDEFDWVHAGWPARVFQSIQRTLWRSPSVVTAPSEWLLKFYQSKKYFRQSKLECVRHYFGVPAARATEFPQAHIARDKFTLLYVGQIVRAKGVLMLIRQFADLFERGEFPDSELIIVGTGDDQKSAEALASSCDAIQIVGARDSSRVAHLMRASDVIVVPSLLYENSPTVVIEALALGRPVSVSNVGGAAELVQHADGGWVVAPNEQAWREHLTWLSNNRQSVVQKIPLLHVPAAVPEFEKLYG